MKKLLLLFTVLFIISCGDDSGKKDPTCDPSDGCSDGKICVFNQDNDRYECEASCETSLDCEDGKSCETISGIDKKGCFDTFYVEGKITDVETDQGIEGGYVTLFKSDGTFISDTVLTDQQGDYKIIVPVIRDDKGDIIDDEKQILYSLKVSAMGYQIYPSILRVAIPFNLDIEESVNSYSSVLTSIALFPIDETGLKMVSGKISEPIGGVLVVAECDLPPCNFGYTDGGGNFNIVNLKSGDYSIKAYQKGYNFDQSDITLSNENISNIILNSNENSKGSISGSVNIVNASGELKTSVVLIPKSTFNSFTKKGELVPSLRAPNAGIDPNIDSNYEITEVPEGEYVILAGFENDDLIRDPDETIAGTEIVELTIPIDGNYDISLESFKVTEAIKLISPGGELIEAVNSVQSFEWVDDSSEDGYIIELFDSFGEKIWEKRVAKNITTIEYDGDSLENNYYYQWKVTSFREDNQGEENYISTSEDLEGIFYIDDTIE